MSASSRSVRTVRGDVPADQLGPTHGHEHVLFSPAGSFGDDLMRTEEAQAIAELAAYRREGGSGLIDATVRELGRDVAALQRVSEATGVHIVAATGHTAEEWWWGDIDPGAQTAEEIADEMIAEITIGIDETPVRAGVVKLGTSLDDITPHEALVIRAAAAAQQATGAPITTHTTAGTQGFDQVAALHAAGADLEKVCVGHLDRRLDWEEHLKIASSGVYLGYDQISKERYQPDSLRAEYVSRLFGEGHGDRILLGSDLARRSDLTAWGGSPGLTHLLASFVGRLGDSGLSSGDIHRLLVDNPRRFLAFA